MKIITRQLVKTILESALFSGGGHLRWSLQGFGMLRLYLSDDVRLHVWSTAHVAVPAPDQVHDHPWSFRSDVIVGSIRNIRYAAVVADQPTYTEVKIKCGPGGGECNNIRRRFVQLQMVVDETVPAGQSYSQHSYEVHESIPADGTVSIITRRFTADTEHARVYVPINKVWTTAEPRPATPEEVRDICANALVKQF